MTTTEAARSTAALRHPRVSAALRSVTAVTGMEASFVGRLDPDTFTFTRVAATRPWAGLEEGDVVDRADVLCARLLDGAPPATSDAAHDPAYRDAPAVRRLGITSYVGVPVERADGSTFGTLCALDRSGVEVTQRTIDTMRELSAIVGLQLDEAITPVVTHTHGGWRVSGLPEDESLTDDLTSAMVLADLLATELGEAARTGRPVKGDPPPDELTRLRQSVGQLEHALAARVVVEQAIGVLAERRRITPRAAFESLRGVARGSGRRVHDLAREVVASATQPGAPLPGSLGRVAGAGTPSPAMVAQAIRGHR